MRIFLEFLLTFIFLYVLYYFLVIRKCLKKKDYVPVEVSLILTIHEINYKKINLYQMIKVVSFITVFILSLIITILSNFFHEIIIVIVFGVVLSILVALICYNYVGRYYKSHMKK